MNYEEGFGHAITFVAIALVVAILSTAAGYSYGWHSAINFCAAASGCKPY